MRKVALGAALMAAALLVGCHTITEELPTEPTEAEKPASTGILTIPIPALSVATAATPTPSPDPSPDPGSPPPAPGPTPEPTPEPSPDPGETFGCGDPLPPTVHLMKVKVHFVRAASWTLDSTALVAGYDYCKEIGFTDGRSRCPVRPEGHPERKACEEYAIGYAEDTGRVGPTWTLDGNLCDGSACKNHDFNQHFLHAYAEGTYKGCAKEGKCGTKTLKW